MSFTKVIQVTTEKRKNASPPKPGMEFSITLPSSLEEAAEMFGEDVCIARLNAQFVIDAQGTARKHMDPRELKDGSMSQELSQAQIQADHFDEWKPLLRAPRKSKQEKIAEDFNSMTPAEKAALLAHLQSSGVVASDETMEEE